eukprot:s49_g78.t1
MALFTGSWPRLAALVASQLESTDDMNDSRSVEFVAQPLRTMNRQFKSFAVRRIPAKICHALMQGVRSIVHWRRG